MKYKKSYQKSNHTLFYLLLKKFKNLKIQEKKLLLAVSGGLDSLSLLSVLLELKTPLKLDLCVAHVHHFSHDQIQKKFQDRAFKLVKKFCEQNNINIYFNKDFLYKKQKKPMLSESDMRAYRYDFFSKTIKKTKADYLVLAHTKEDLLETRLIRLIRGTGEQGVRAMLWKKNSLLRPFLDISRETIKDYAQKKQLNWAEDPSNLDIDYSFRNWIRINWLNQLEQKRPGAKKALARSLDLLAKKNKQSSKKATKIYSLLIKKQALRRDIIFLFSPIDRKKIVAFYFKNLGLKNYQSSHIEELLKRLKNPQKNLSFSLLKKNWRADSYWLFLLS